ncbi:hypothetical protein PC122_g10645 [Phytophthora cactorum]|nr:hypothetical protein PC122_g10645 [Phytophthora cactorum]
MFYAASDTAYEIQVVLLLPVIKIVMKYVIASSLNAMEDMMPKAVIFSVDFFHAVYLATCVQHHFGVDFTLQFSWMKDPEDFTASR